MLRFPGTFFALLLFSYTTLTALVFQSLNCVPVAGRSVVFSQPSVDCDSAIYRTWLGWIYALLAFPVVGFPLALAIFLTYIKLKKVPPSRILDPSFLGVVTGSKGIGGNFEPVLPALRDSVCDLPPTKVRPDVTALK